MFVIILYNNLSPFHSIPLLQLQVQLLALGGEAEEWICQSRTLQIHHFSVYPYK